MKTEVSQGKWSIDVDVEGAQRFSSGCEISMRPYHLAF